MKERDYCKLIEADRETLELYCKQNGIYVDYSYTKRHMILLIRNIKGKIDTISF